MFKLWTAKISVGFDIATHLLGSCLGALVGWVCGTLFGVLIASFVMEFKRSYIGTAASKAEVFEYLRWKEIAKNKKREKKNNGNNTKGNDSK